MFKAKTVATVFSKFTKDLEAVSRAQDTIVSDASKERAELEIQVGELIVTSLAAKAEATQARNAIKNIGELLGIKEGSMMVKKS